jgi:carbonic anhydrase/acetyltransferase-like protein (isoleucine patch superfamily)
MNKKPLIFVGARQTMATLATIPEALDIEVLGILDSHYYGNREEYDGIPIIGDDRWLLDPDNREADIWRRYCQFFPGNWNDGGQGNKLEKLRLSRINMLDQLGLDVPNLIHPDASVPGLNSKYGVWSLGRGIQILPQALVMPDHVHIGDYSSIAVGAKVTHHVNIGRNVIIQPNTFTYNCNVGDNTVIGIHSRMNPITNRMRIMNIGSNVTIWHGSIVDRDIPDNHIWTTNGRVLRKTINQVENE